MAKIEINEELFNELQKGAKLVGIGITQFVNEALGEWNETFGQALEPAEPESLHLV